MPVRDHICMHTSLREVCIVIGRVVVKQLSNASCVIYIVLLMILLLFLSVVLLLLLLLQVLLKSSFTFYSSTFLQSNFTFTQVAFRLITFPQVQN